MSIESTRYVTREWCIERIKLISDLARKGWYYEVSIQTNEADYDLEMFVIKYNDDIENIDKWTDQMVETKIDEPFYRSSMFENYFIGVEQND